MKKRLLTFIILALGIASLDARHGRVHLTNPDAPYKQSNVDAQPQTKLQKPKAKKRKAKAKKSKAKAKKSKAKKSKSKSKVARKKAKGKKPSKARKPKSKSKAKSKVKSRKGAKVQSANRLKRKKKKIRPATKLKPAKKSAKQKHKKAARKESAKRKAVIKPQPKKGKLDPHAAHLMASAHEASMNVHQANVDAADARVQAIDSQLKSARRRQRNKAHGATDKQLHKAILDVRHAEDGPDHEKAKQASCEMHHTCDSVEVQALSGKLRRAKRAHSHASIKHADAKDNAERAHKKAGTHDHFVKRMQEQEGKARAQGKESRGSRRHSNHQTEVTKHAIKHGNVKEKRKHKELLNKAQNMLKKSKAMDKKKVKAANKKSQSKKGSKVRKPKSKSKSKSKGKAKNKKGAKVQSANKLKRRKKKVIPATKLKPAQPVTKGRRGFRGEWSDASL